MSDLRIAYNEYMVGANHPTKTDTLNRHANVEHNTDGTHKMTGGTAGKMYYHDGTKLTAFGPGATTEILVGGGAAVPVWTTATGSGAPVRATSPTLVTPVLGTPTSGDLQNCTAATTTTKGVVELATIAETVAGTSTTLTPTCDGVAAAVAVLAREPDQGVNMTAAASGSTGITVADNDNIDFGTGNFTLVWRGSLPDWTPSTLPSLFFQKIVAGVTGYRFGITTTTGYPYVIIYRADTGTTYTASTAQTLVDGTNHLWCAVITRETSSVAGSVVFYLDGYQFGSSQEISASAPVSISNSGTLYISGDSTTRYASNSSFAATFNRALTAAEVLDLYRNGIAEADKWGSQTAVYTSDFSAGVDSWASFRGTNAGNIDSIGGEDNCLRFYANADNAGPHAAYYNIPSALRYKYVEIIARVYVPSANTNLKKVFIGINDIWDHASGNSITANAWETLTVRAVINGTSIRIIASTADNSLFFVGANVDTDDLFYVKDVTIKPLGATLALEPGGAQPAPGQWLDSSSNKLHAMQPAAGSSLTRYKKEFEFRWTNTWTASSAAQYVGGLNQAVLSADHFITDIITQATVTTDVENLTLGDGSDADRFVTAFAPSATRTKQTIANQNDGTNLKLVYTPAAEATMTVETIIRGFIWEP